MVYRNRTANAAEPPAERRQSRERRRRLAEQLRANLKRRKEAQRQANEAQAAPPMGGDNDVEDGDTA